MSETKKNCPDCEHLIGNHAHEGSGFTHLCAIPYCPCTRTYESLVEEKGKTRLTMKPDEPSMPIPVGEKGWMNREASAYANYVGLDAPPESAKYEQVAGLMVEKATDKIPGVTLYDTQPTAVDEPELQLLVCDFGEHCIVKIERGEPKLWAIRAFEQSVPVGYNMTPIVHFPHSFKRLKDAIDGEKPVPRIERCGKGYLFYPYNRDPRCISFTLSKTDYDALSKLAGKPLPIYSGGKWEMLTGSAERLCNETGITIWRYTR